ncbi:hypothetical protein FQA39_LY14195 [Lamprigera yunnana]|nr:hypothetical protein FQA39_LY14195 [Lamprigera yunnana]
MFNAAGFGERNVKKWQKTWTDYKYNMKKKASNLKRDVLATGPSTVTKLTKVELKLLAILEPHFMKG